jgi:hypothetical protein
MYADSVHNIRTETDENVNGGSKVAYFSGGGGRDSKTVYTFRQISVTCTTSRTEGF